MAKERDEVTGDRKVINADAKAMLAPFELDLAAWGNVVKDLLLAELEDCCAGGESPEMAIQRVTDLV